MTTQRRVLYVGNFGPPHSTENHVRQALERLGHRVVPLQENESVTWEYLAGAIVDPPDLVLWTRTWHLPQFDQLGALQRLRDSGVPTVGFHLDRWWGLPRSHQVHEEPFFQCELVVTADGGHDDYWPTAGVNHVWMPPAISLGQAELQPRPVAGVPPIVFVGGVHRYHPEWPWRGELVRRLQRTFGRSFGLYPKGAQAVRGQALTDLYGSARVIVGDSCLVGSPARYWSDRVPETIGRGGFLIHPHVHGIEEHHHPGEHLALVPQEDWPAMEAAVRHWASAAQDEERRHIAAAGRAHVMVHHTYERRMEQLLEILENQGLLGSVHGGGGLVRVTSGGVGPATFDLRPDTSDGIVVHETWNENVYGLTADDVAGRVVLDLGANVGAFSVWAALAGAAKVVAVEPASENVDRLRDAIERNDVTVQVERVAVGDVAALGRVQYDPLAPGGSTVIEQAVDDLADGEAVAITPLAMLVDVACGGHVHVVKMDVEGAEYETLAGAATDGTLAKVDRIVGEWHRLGDHLTAGRFLCGLLRYGTLRIFGDPDQGGQFTWTRYGA